MDFGPLPEKRYVPDFVHPYGAEELVLKTLKRQADAGAGYKKQAEDTQEQADRLAEKLALQVHKKRFTEKDPFLQSLRQLLKSEGIHLVTYVGEAVTEALEDAADIVEWLPAEENLQDMVVDALEPEIHWQGRLLHRAKLSCRMAIEAEEETPLPPSEPSVPPDGNAPGENAFQEDGEDIRNRGKRIKKIAKGNARRKPMPKYTKRNKDKKSSKKRRKK